MLGWLAARAALRECPLVCRDGLACPCLAPGSRRMGLSELKGSCRLFKQLVFQKPQTLACQAGMSMEAELPGRTPSLREAACGDLQIIKHGIKDNYFDKAGAQGRHSSWGLWAPAPSTCPLAAMLGFPLPGGLDGANCCNACACCPHLRETPAAVPRTMALPAPVLCLQRSSSSGEDEVVVCNMRTAQDI